MRERLQRADGILIPGGFGGRGIEGKIAAARVAREQRIPYLGICLGMHVAVAEFARHVAGMDGANSTEMDVETPYPVIDLLPEQKEVANLGGTMRLGADPIKLHDGSRVREIYGEAVVYERHRHRYEVNNLLRKRLEAAGLRASGTSPDERLVEVIELGRPPVLRRLAVPPRVQVPPGAPGSAVSRLRRRRAGARGGEGDRRERGRRRRVAADRAVGDPQRRRARRAVTLRRRAARAIGELERRYLNGTFAELCRIAEPVGQRARVRRARHRRAARARRRASSRTTRGRARGRLRQPARADPGGAKGRPRAAPRMLLCAHLDTVPLLAPVEPVLVDGFWENANEGILGADNKAAIAVMLALARHVCRAGLRRSTSSCCSRSARRRRWPARGRSTPARLSSDFGYVFDHASPIGEVVVDSPTHFRIEADFRGAAAHAGIRPEQGRSAILAAARAIAAMRVGRLDEQTTVNVGTIAGGSAMNVVPERCSLVAEVRSLDETQRRGDGGGGRRPHARGGQPAGVRVRRGHRRAAHVLGLSSHAERPAVRVAEAALRSVRPRARADRQRRRARTPTRCSPTAWRSSTSQTAPSATTSRASASAWRRWRRCSTWRSRCSTRQPPRRRTQSARLQIRC